jgi:citrate lyase subunit beta/citryl-CoA lyase
MPTGAHPREVLYRGEKPFPILPAVDHYAGSEKLMLKALDLQATLGPIFDVTCDCEDGAPPGREREHAEMVVRTLNGASNRHGRAGARVHDHTHPHWKSDVDIIVAGAGSKLSHITIPKPTAAAQVAEMIDYIGTVAAKSGISRTIPINVLIETHGALHEAYDIAALPGMQVLDFGLMDLVSSHHGAIPGSAMRSPGQFEHRLLARALTEVASAALANGIVPAHGVTLDLKNPQTVHDDALRARNEFGFLRKWSIHPIQIQPIVDAMKPAHTEVLDAARILVAGQAANWGPIQDQGELHDRASYRYYWETLQKARVTGVSIPDDAVGAFF